MITRAAAWALAGLIGTAGALHATTSLMPQTPPRLTVAELKQLKSTSNDPSGDAFVGSPAQLGRLIDAMVSDSALVSPTYLFLASTTAFTLNRVADAAFLFYAAQLRTAFDFERYDIARQPDGNNAATYLGFLRQTIGMSVNPAIMREPARFAEVMDRLEKWEMVPSREAYYPEFASAKGFKIPQEKWAETAATIKQGFMTQFGRRQARLLNDAEYFEAFRFVQGMNLGELPQTSDTKARYTKSLATMEAAEKRLFPPAPSPAASPQRAGEAPVRVGGNIPQPKLLRRVDPQFPAGATGSVILELIVGTSGAVEDVRI